MQQAQDFLEESRALFALIDPLDQQAFETVTQFKGWTIADVLRHLHVWNHAVLLALESPAEFGAFFEPIGVQLASGKSLRDYEYGYLDGVSGDSLKQLWEQTYERAAAAFGSADPAARLPWAGPSMSARSAISARQMETWAHGQEVFDVLGAEREDSDRIRNVVVLGVNTYGWTFQARKQTPPEPVPELVLTAPSGEVWQFGEPQSDNRISGSAVDFARVVTQTRNVLDTGLEVVGQNAQQWMHNAQCFAGGAQQPPAPGSRFKV